MRQLRLNSVLVIFFVTGCFRGFSQEVINQVSIQKAGKGLYQVQYQLKQDRDYDAEIVNLKIFRKRGGAIEEIFSENITSKLVSTQASLYRFNWKPEKDLLKTGDELQAKVIISFRPAVARQKSKPGNKQPYADAGNTMEVELPINKPIVLNGSGSHDEDGRISTARWKQIAGPVDLVVSHADSLLASVSGEFKEGTYAFELSVTDNAGATAISRTILHVKPGSYLTNSPAKSQKQESSVGKPPVTNSTVAAVPQKENAIKPQVPSKKMAPLKGGPSNAFINLLVPGLGHYYVSGDHKGEGRKPAAFAITGVYAGSIGAAFYFKSKSDQDYKKYTELSNYREYQRDANGIITGVRGAEGTQATEYYNSARAAHRNSMIALGVGGAILAGDFVYTLFRGNKNKAGWKREATSFRPQLFISSDGVRTTAGIQIKLP